MEENKISQQLKDLRDAAELGTLKGLPLELRRRIYHFVHAPIDKIDLPTIKKRACIGQDEKVFMSISLFPGKIEELGTSQQMGLEMLDVFEHHAKEFGTTFLIQLYNNRNSPAFFKSLLCYEDLNKVDFDALEEAQLRFIRHGTVEFARYIEKTDLFYRSYAVYPFPGVQQFPPLELFPNGNGITIRLLPVDDDTRNLVNTCNQESPIQNCPHGGLYCDVCSVVGVVTPRVSVQAGGPLEIHNGLARLYPWEQYNILPRWTLNCEQKRQCHAFVSRMIIELGGDAVWIVNGGLYRTGELGF